MPSLKDLRGRIRSVKNTQQITKTMKMVAVAKVKRAREACEAARPYATRMSDVLTQLAAATNVDSAPPLLVGRTPVRTVRMLVFGSDRGLCGGFNGNLVRKVVHDIHTHRKAGRHVQIVTIGRKTRALLKADFGDMIVTSHNDISQAITFDLAAKLANDVRADFEAEKCDQVILYCNAFVSMMTQTPQQRPLIPYLEEMPDQNKIPDISQSRDFEPDEETILTTLLPRNLAVQIYNAMLESSASEHAARMTAMDNATRNAGEMIRDLSLEYNRSRQATITSELIEIISGAEAL